MKSPAIAALILIACGAPPAPADVATTPTPAKLPIDAPGGLIEAIGEPVHIEARDLVLEGHGQVRVRYLSGRLMPAGNGDLVDLEIPSSFEVVVDALEIAIPEQTLQGAVSAASDGQKAPFRRVVVRMEGDSVSLTGNLRTLGLPFSFRANPRVTESGTLALELEKVRVLGVGARGFLGAFQGAIEHAANKEGHLLDVDEDRLILNPFPFAGPPEIHAEFTSVEVHEHELVARLGELTPREEGAESSGLFLTGGTLRTGPMVLFGSEIRIVADAGGDLVIGPEGLPSQIERGWIAQAHDGSVTIHAAAPE